MVEKEGICKQCKDSFEKNEGIAMTHFNMACPIPFCSCPQSKVYEWHWAMPPHVGERAFVLIDGNGTNRRMDFKHHIFECKYKCDLAETYKSPNKQKISQLMGHCATYWSERTEYLKQHGAEYLTQEEATEIFTFYKQLTRSLMKQALAAELDE